MACQQNDGGPSIESLRAYVVGELHGDGAGELAAHLEQCASCSRRVRMMEVVEHCNHLIGTGSGSAELAAETSRTEAAWQRLSDGLFELPKQLLVMTGKLHDLLVTWADRGALAASFPTPQPLMLGAKKQVERHIPIIAGAGDFPCTLSVVRDTHGDTRIAVGFQKRAARDYGVLRIRISRHGELIESRSVGDRPWVAFDFVLSAGEYLIELRGGSGVCHRIGLKVE